jgi:hypothetical protein
MLEEEQFGTVKRNGPVTWTTSGKIDRSNAKLRERHLELVAARVVRDKRRWLQQAERGLE